MLTSPYMSRPVKPRPSGSGMQKRYLYTHSIVFPQLLRDIYVPDTNIPFHTIRYHYQPLFTIRNFLTFHLFFSADLRISSCLENLPNTFLIGFVVVFEHSIIFMYTFFFLLIYKIIAKIEIEMKYTYRTYK